MDRLMISDAQWQQIEPHLPGKQNDCGVTAKDNRLFLEAVLWIDRTGSPWRDLPEGFGQWHRVYVRYNRWAHKGIWKRIFEKISSVADVEFIHIDGTIARVHQHGASKKTIVKTKVKDVPVAA